MKVDFKAVDCGLNCLGGSVIWRKDYALAC